MDGPNLMRSSDIRRRGRGTCADGEWFLCLAQNSITKRNERGTRQHAPPSGRRGFGLRVEKTKDEERRTKGETEQRPQGSELQRIHGIQGLEKRRNRSTWLNNVSEFILRRSIIGCSTS